MKQASAWCLALVLTVGAGVRAAAPIETKHLIVTASSPAVAVAPGTRVSLTLDVTPKKTMHVYAPEQKEYIPISLTLQADSTITPSVVQFPRPEKLRLDASDDSQRAQPRT